MHLVLTDGSVLLATVVRETTSEVLVRLAGGDSLVVPRPRFRAAVPVSTPAAGSWHLVRQADGTGTVGLLVGQDDDVIVLENPATGARLGLDRAAIAESFSFAFADLPSEDQAALRAAAREDPAYGAPRRASPPGLASIPRRAPPFPQGTSPSDGQATADPSGVEQTAATCQASADEALRQQMESEVDRMAERWTALRQDVEMCADLPGRPRRVCLDRVRDFLDDVQRMMRDAGPVTRPVQTACGQIPATATAHAPDQQAWAYEARLAEKLLRTAPTRSASDMAIAGGAAAGAGAVLLGAGLAMWVPGTSVGDTNALGLQPGDDYQQRYDGWLPSARAEVRRRDTGILFTSLGIGAVLTGAPLAITGASKRARGRRLAITLGLATSELRTPNGGWVVAGGRF